MLWQGGFLFYAAVVVPTGTEVLGSFEQGRVTRHVTDWLNGIGAVTLSSWPGTSGLTRGRAVPAVAVGAVGA